MSYSAGTSSDPVFRPMPAFDAAANPALYDGVLSKRALAFVVDFMVIVMWLVVASIVVFVLGILTLGLGWLLYGPLGAIVALGYVAVTLGGPASATWGMRMTGIEMRTLSGGRMYPLLAALHAFLFWLTVTALTPLVLVLGLLNPRKRLLHDFLTGAVVVNSYALARREV